jgi:hypothetical protein
MAMCGKYKNPGGWPGLLDQARRSDVAFFLCSIPPGVNRVLRDSLTQARADEDEVGQSRKLTKTARARAGQLVKLG